MRHRLKYSRIHIKELVILHQDILLIELSPYVSSKTLGMKIEPAFHDATNFILENIEKSLRKRQVSIYFQSYV